MLSSCSERIWVESKIHVLKNGRFNKTVEEVLIQKFNIFTEREGAEKKKSNIKKKKFRKKKHSLDIFCDHVKIYQKQDIFVFFEKKIWHFLRVILPAIWSKPKILFKYFFVSREKKSTNPWV